MDFRTFVISLGVGATAFLVVTVAVIELLGGDFPSALVALPIGLLAGLVIAAGTYLRLDADAGTVVRSGAIGLATLSYAFFGLWFLRYAVAAVRPVATFPRIIAASVLLAAAVALLTLLQFSRVQDAEPTGGGVDR